MVDVTDERFEEMVQEALDGMPPGLQGRDHSSSADTWVVLAELESGYFATVLDLPAEDDIAGRIAVTRGQSETMRSQRAEDVLALFLRGRRERL